MIRANRRVRDPFGRRGAGDLSARRRLGLEFADLDGAIAVDENKGWNPASRPRILWREPRRTFHHPVTEQDVLALLESVGALAVYGLRSIEFVRIPASSHPMSLTFGRYETPGRILLFEQALSPWHLHGKLSQKDLERFVGYGAAVSQMPQSGVMVINWPATTLKRFMLEEVLLHELGHHVLQYHKGKRLDRIARTKDHEAFAALFAARQQRDLAERIGPN